MNVSHQPEGYFLAAASTAIPWTDLFEKERTFRYIIVVVASSLLISLIINNVNKVKAPYVGYRGLWEPTFWLRIRFMFEARTMVQEGYRKFRDNMFVVRRMDTDMLIISNKYVEELRSIPHSKLGAIEALQKVSACLSGNDIFQLGTFKGMQGIRSCVIVMDLIPQKISKNWREFMPSCRDHVADMHQNMGKFTTTEIALDGDLHIRVLQTKLTPNLGKISDIIQNEADFAIETEVPKSEGIVPLNSSRG